MTKIVILGSSKYGPYEILAVPNKIPNAWNTEEGYKEASKIFYPAIDKADIVFVYAPDGIGHHTQRDIDYAKAQGKWVVIATKKEVCEVASKIRSMKGLVTLDDDDTEEDVLISKNDVLALLIGESYEYSGVQ